jgi:hypothetical protein
MGHQKLVQDDGDHVVLGKNINRPTTKKNTETVLVASKKVGLERKLNIVTRLQNKIIF